MSDRKEGLRTALAELGVGTGPEPSEAQDDLFQTEAPLPLSPAQSGPKGGRPKGARNKRTEEWVNHILSRYRSPLIGLAEIAARPVRQLAVELEMYARSPSTGLVLYGGDGQPVLRSDALLEVLKIQKAAMAELAPYLHQRQPQAVEVQTKARGLLVIGELGAVLGQADGLALPLAPPLEERPEPVDITPEKEA